MSQTLSITINTTKLMEAFKRAPAETAQILRVVLKSQLAQVQKIARQEHRFITRTGFLERAIEKDVDDSGLIGIIYINTSFAPYGVYVHRGHGSWKADEFLYEAFRKQKVIMIEKIKIALNIVFKKVGL